VSLLESSRDSCWSERRVPEPRSRRIEERIGDRSWNRNDGRLANSKEPEVGATNQKDFNGGKILESQRPVTSPIETLQT